MSLSNTQDDLALVLRDEVQAEQARLLDARQREAEARELYASAYRSANQPWPIKESDYAAVGEKDRMFTARQALEVLNKQSERVREAEGRLRQAAYRAAALPRWRARRAELAGAMQQQYDGLGPQYAVLVDMVVEAKLRAEQIVESGQPVSPEATRRASQDVLAAVAALQKHTESTKSEYVERQVREQVLRVVRVIEEVVQPENPALWHRAATAAAGICVPHPMLEARAGGAA